MQQNVAHLSQMEVILDHTVLVHVLLPGNQVHPGIGRLLRMALVMRQVWADHREVTKMSVFVASSLD